MFVPFITKRTTGRLFPRKGGGGGGKGSSSGSKSSSSGSKSSSSGSKSSGSSGSSSSSSGSSSSSSSSSSSKTTRKSSVSGGGRSRTSSSYGRGGGKPSTIPAGQPFAGRAIGGGTRAQIFGTKQYGSGYPGIAGRGVAGRGFPFYFWPIAWGGVAGAGTAAYLHSDEYGLPDNTTRPGGPMYTAAFNSNTTSTVFRVVADNTTVVSLIADLSANCSSRFSGTPNATPLNASAAEPQPEQVLQYYRASSAALTLDGYNNTAVFEPEGTPDSSLPDGVDAALLDCLNQTMGLALPLIDGAQSSWAPPNISLLGLFWLLGCLIGWM